MSDQWAQTPAVVFNFQTWTTMFPEFANCDPGAASGWFNRACALCSDTVRQVLASSINAPPGTLNTPLQTALYLLTAHIGWLNAPRDALGNPTSGTGSGQPPIAAQAPAVVGRVSSASEGSVSAQLDYGAADAGSPSQAWYVQTRYGAEYWALTSATRTMQYVPGPRRFFGPFFTGRGCRFGGW